MIVPIASPDSRLARLLHLVDRLPLPEVSPRGRGRMLLYSHR